MGNVFRYELRRMVCSKIFVGILAIILWFAWQTLNSQTIQGVAHTAPFSPWTFGSYINALLPLLSLSLVFFLWEVSSGRARRVELLADATQTERRKLLLIRGCAVAAAWLLLALAAVLLGLGFLLTLFSSAVPLGEVLAAAALALLPVLLFLLGLGLLAGRVRPGLVFFLVPVTALLLLLPFPMSVQLFVGDLFSVWPLSLPLDPPLSVPPSLLAGRLLYSLAGLAAVGAAGMRVSKANLGRRR